jgi:ribonucleoside-diphosphate reductase alpha chain
LGAVLEVNPPTKEDTATKSETANSTNPMRTVIGSRPKGSLDAVAEKIEYWTYEGQKTLYLIVSFLPVPRADGSGLVDRAIEFFMPVGQSGESQQWITSSMRLLSLAARGGFLERALSDMRKVAWDRGPVRHGFKTKEDGTQVPLWHDSEVGAIAFAIQNILQQRALRNNHGLDANPLNADSLRFSTPSSNPTLGAMAGKKCPECGAHAMIRKDGCDYCTECGHVGACG